MIVILERWGAAIVFALSLLVTILLRLRHGRRRVEVSDKGLVVDRTFAFGWPDIRRLDFWIQKGIARYVVHLGASKYAFTHAEATLDDPLRLKHMIIEKAGLHKIPSGNLRLETFTRPGDPNALPVSLLADIPRPSKPGVVSGAIGAVFLGLSHAKWWATLISALASIGAYRFLFPSWKFAIGFILITLIHELGHAVVMRAHGLRAGAPVFIPFIGALISLRDQPRDAMVEAEVGYGGPMAGALAATACYAMFYFTQDATFLLLALAGFFLNLFNLIPVSPLDGGRITSAISTRIWLVGVVVIGLLFVLTWNVLLLAIAAMGLSNAWRTWRDPRRMAHSKYYDVPTSYRISMGLAYFSLAAFLGWMTWNSMLLIQALPRA